MLAASKEEQCNYLLCTDSTSGIPRSFRISRIHALYSTPDIFIPDADTRRELQEAAIRNPQSASKNIEAKVFLTDKGIQKKKLTPGSEPKAEFALLDGEKVVSAYEFCNLHKLWKC